MELQNGSYVIGQMEGYVAEPWQNDPSKFNHKLVLQRPYTDRFGNEARNYISINIQTADIPRAQQLGQQLKDKRVIVAVVNKLKSGTSMQTGKPYAFIDTFLPKDGIVEEVSKVMGKGA